MSPPLRLGRDYYRDITDEYVPSWTWSGERVLQDSTEHHLRIVLRVLVYCDRKGRRNVPTGMTAYVEFAGARLYIPSDTVEGMSFAQIEHYANEGDFQRYVNEALRLVYRREVGICVSRVRSDSSFEPLMTWFAPVWGVDGFALPFGEYVLASRSEKRGLQFWQLSRYGYGCSTRCDPKMTEEIQKYADQLYWLDEKGGGG